MLVVALKRWPYASSRSCAVSGCNCGLATEAMETSAPVPLVVGGQLMLDGAPYTGGANAISEGSGSLNDLPPVMRKTSRGSGRYMKVMRGSKWVELVSSERWIQKLPNAENWSFGVHASRTK